MKITMIMGTKGDTTSWTFDISQEDLDILCDKYENKGSSIRGTLSAILSDTFKNM